MGRTLSKALDEAAEHVADRMVPVMIDAIRRVDGLKFDYTKGNWEAVLAAVTEKLPHKIGKFPMTKDERLEILAAIDFLDRSSRSKGHDETLTFIVRALIGMKDMSGAFARYLNLRVMDEDGNDITGDVFG